MVLFWGGSYPSSLSSGSSWEPGSDRKIEIADSHGCDLWVRLLPVTPLHGCHLWARLLPVTPLGPLLLLQRVGI